MDAANILSNSLSQSRATLMQQVGKDGKDLDALQRQANDLTKINNPDELSKKHKELRAVAKEYEALFFQQLMSAMDKTIDRSNSMLSGGNTEEMFRDMLNQEMASAASNRPGQQGLGIADAIYQQMSLVLDGKLHPPTDTQLQSSSGKPQTHEGIKITGQLNPLHQTHVIHPLSNTDKTHAAKPIEITKEKTEAEKSDDKQKEFNQHQQQQAYLPNELSTIYKATPSTLQ